MDASFPSVARTRGFWSSLVFELVARNCATVGGIVIEKFEPVSVLRVFTLTDVPVDVVVVAAPVDPVVVVPVVEPLAVVPVPVLGPV